MRKAAVESALQQAGGELRQDLRREVHLRVSSVSDAHGIQNGVVRNVSMTGILIDTAAPLSIGDLLDVDLPHGISSAEVVWVGDGLVGCRFEAALTRSQVSAALLKAEPNSPLTSAALAIPPATVSLPREMNGTSVFVTKGWHLIALAGTFWFTIAMIWIAVG